MGITKRARYEAARKRVLAITDSRIAPGVREAVLREFETAIVQYYKEKK
jgi:hypothetical protein